MKFLIAFLLTTSVSVPSSVQTSPLQERFERIENNIKPKYQVNGLSLPPKTLKQRMEELNVPGLSVAVALDGKIVWARGYGLADIAQQRPVTTKTLFQAAQTSCAPRSAYLPAVGSTAREVKTCHTLNRILSFGR